MYHNCVSLCSLCEGKEGTKAIYKSLLFFKQGITRNIKKHIVIVSKQFAYSESNSAQLVEILISVT